MFHRKSKIQQNVVAYVKSRHQKIAVKPKQGLFNFKCFWNAKEYALNHKNTMVVEVVYIDAGLPVLHYINKDTTTGTYYETTLGHLATELEYYLIKEVSDYETANMLTVFEDSLAAWLQQFTNWFDRSILNIERVV